MAAINKQLDSELLSGQLDTLVLSILSEADMYGFNIFKQLKQITNDRVTIKETSLYSCYKRLEGKNYVFSYWGDETQGGRRRYYSITEPGKMYLKEQIGTWKELFTMLLDIYERTENKL